MSVSLKPELEKIAQQKVNAGLFPSVDALVNAAVEQFVTGDDFTAGELDDLLAVGEAQAREGRFVEGDEAFRRVQARSEARRKGA